MFHVKAHSVPQLCPTECSRLHGEAREGVLTADAHEVLREDLDEA